MLILYLIVNLVIIVNGQTKKHPEEKMEESFDFIIVGSGAAGCVIASRLSEITTWKILLLEAGEKTTNYLTHIPALAATNLFTEPKWDYLTEPQNNMFRGFKNNQIHWQSGKSLGGSSTINFMMYTRGNPNDYNNWEKLGNPDWSYDQVLPYFLKSEAANLQFSNKPYHNDSGLMSIEYSYYSDTTTTYLKVMEAAGYPIQDYNSGNQIGFSPIQATLRAGSRQTVNDAFLAPSVKKRANLKVITGAQVIKIMIDEKTRKARGVKFVQNGKRIRVLATKEVIISAGTINSAKLLMLSGIGPKTDLEQLQIPLVVADLPVGKNVRDHIAYLGLNFLSPSNVTEISLMANYIKEIPMWYASGAGVLTSAGGFESIGFLTTNNSATTFPVHSSSILQPPSPDFELLFTNTIMNKMFKEIANIKDNVYAKFYQPRETQIKWSIYPVLLHPKSFGQIKLKSKNYKEPPLIQPNYLTHSDDLKTMREAIRFVRRNLIESDRFKETMLTLNTALVPGCEQLLVVSDAYWDCALRTLTTTLSDQFGSCRMGPAALEQDSVVDHRFKVHRVHGLRVADASVIPTTISGHLYAVTVMIGERAADFIKNDYSDINN